MSLSTLFFGVLNPTVKFLLASPLHRVLSRSVTVILFDGRKSGRRLSVPVRYVRDGDRVFCLTGHEMPWWHNFKSAYPVYLLLNRQWCKATAQAYWQAEPEIIEAMTALFTQYPQDAKLYGVRMRQGKPHAADVAAAAPGAVLVACRLSSPSPKTPA